MAIDHNTAITPMDFAGMANLRSEAKLKPDEGTLTEAAQQFEALFVSLAHTDTDIGATITAAGEVLGEIVGHA